MRAIRRTAGLAVLGVLTLSSCAQPSPLTPEPGGPPAAPSASATTAATPTPVPEPLRLQPRALESHEVREWVTPEGATLTGDLPGGARFRLEIPPDALLSGESVRVVAIDAVAGLPFGELLTGVRLEPVGLRLLLPATLTLEPGTAPPISEEAAVRAAGPDDELVLWPLVPSSRESVVMVFEFDEYLLTRIGADDLEAIQGFEPSAPMDRYLNSIAPLVYALRSEALAFRGVAKVASPRQAGTDLQGDTTLQQLVQRTEAQRRSIERMVQEALRSTDRDFILSVLHQVLEFERFQQILGLAPAEDDSVWNEALALIQHLADVIMNDVERRCRTHFDLEAVQDLLAVARMLQLLGIDDGTDPRIEQLLARCMALTLEFDSQIDDSPWVEAGHSYGFRVATTIPLVFDLELSGWTGAAPIEWVDAWATPYEGVGSDSGNIICQAAVIEDLRPSTAEVVKLTVNLNDKPQPPYILMAFSPGTPRLHIYHDCANLGASSNYWTGPTREYRFEYWSDLFLQNYGYLGGDLVLVEGVAWVTDWQVVNQPGLFAVKEFLQEGEPYAEPELQALIPFTTHRFERTTFRLIH